MRSLKGRGWVEGVRAGVDRQREGAANGVNGSQVGAEPLAGKGSALQGHSAPETDAADVPGAWTAAGPGGRTHTRARRPLFSGSDEDEEDGAAGHAQLWDDKEGRLQASSSGERGSGSSDGGSDGVGVGVDGAPAGRLGSPHGVSEPCALEAAGPHVQAFEQRYPSFGRGLVDRLMALEDAGVRCGAGRAGGRAGG